MKKLAGLIIFILGIQFSYGQNGDFIETNGVKIFYETHGKGEPLLLVHGFTISGKAWHPWVEDLSKDYLLIIPDLRGHGNSTNPSQKFTHRLSAEDMYGLMDALDIERFKAMGQSSGAMTLLHMATMDTTRISDLILVSGTSYFPPQHKKGLEDFNYEDFKSWHKDKIHLKSDEQITMIYKQFKKFPETFDDMNFTTPYLAQIKCPTLIIHGDRDQFFLWIFLLNNLNQSRILIYGLFLMKVTYQ